MRALRSLLLLPGLAAVSLFGQAPFSIINGDPFACFGPNMEIDSNGSGTLSTVAVSGPGFSKAWDLKTTLASANPWEVRARCFNTLAVNHADVVVATFWMRTITPGQGLTQGETTFVFENSVAASNYAKSVNFTASAGEDWTRFDVVFSPLANYDAAASASTTDPLAYNLNFWVDYTGQHIQIGGLQVIDYGPNFDAYSLNLPNYPYAGHDPNAPWRIQALQRIERIRKADIAVVLRDSFGNPIMGAPVHVRMKKHAFGWGTAIDGDSILTEPRYAQAVLADFNKLVPENDLKWTSFEAGSQNAANDLSFASANGYTMFRGHNLIWPSLAQYYMPADVDTLVSSLLAKGVANDAADLAALNNRIDTHFATMLNFTRGRATEWDVVNEPYSNTDVVKALGQDPQSPPILVHWYQLARSLDPTIKLYLNDYCLVACGGADQAHINFTANLVKYLLAQGAPVDGIGMQSHFDTNLTPLPRVLDLLDFWGSLGPELQVTEYDINIADQQVQADYTRDYLIACFSHPKMAGFMLWGFFGGHAWLPNPLFYDAQWNERKAHLVWRDLVYNQWWTDVSGVTGPDGVFHTRGFLGDYAVTYTVAGAPTTVPLTLAAGQINVVSAGPAPAAPAFDAAHVLNVASLQPGPVSSGEMIAISGAHIGQPSVQLGTPDDQGNLPTALAVTRVLFDGVPARLVAAVSGEVFVIVPPGLGSSTSIVVETLGSKSAPVVVPTAAASPAFFTCAASPDLPILYAASAPGSESCLAGAAKVSAGEAVTLYATGLSSGANQVLFAGAPAASCSASAIAQAEPGVWTVTACIPAAAAAGPLEVRLQSATIMGPPVHVTVH